jgi:hypothetical protein
MSFEPGLATMLRVNYGGEFVGQSTLARDQP